MATSPRAMAEEALRVWEATPAWPNGARSAFERHRLVLEDLEALKPKLRARLLLRAAELSYGMGGYVASGLLRPQIAVDALDPPGRDRHTFLSARLAARTPEAASLPTLVADGSALEEMRLHTVRAEAAFTLGRFDEAVAEWENVLESDAPWRSSTSHPTTRPESTSGCTRRWYDWGARRTCSSWRGGRMPSPASTSGASPDTSCSTCAPPNAPQQKTPRRPSAFWKRGSGSWIRAPKGMGGAR